MLNYWVPALAVSKILGRANASVTLMISAYSTLNIQAQAASVTDEMVPPMAFSISHLQLIGALTDLHPFVTPHIWLNLTEIPSKD